jgi:hypothetical protein
VGWTRPNSPASSLLSIALTIVALLVGPTGAEAQSDGATVRASVTIVDVVGVGTGASLKLTDAGPGSMHVGGSLEVTSPVPHILTSSLGPADLSWVDRQFSRVRSGADGAVPQQVDVALDRAEPGRPMKLVYTIAVIL